MRSTLGGRRGAGGKERRKEKKTQTQRKRELREKN